MKIEVIKINLGEYPEYIFLLQFLPGLHLSLIVQLQQHFLFYCFFFLSRWFSFNSTRCHRFTEGSFQSMKPGGIFSNLLMLLIIVTARESFTVTSRFPFFPSIKVANKYFYLYSDVVLFFCSLKIFFQIQVGM